MMLGSSGGSLAESSENSIFPTPRSAGPLSGMASAQFLRGGGEMLAIRRLSLR